MFAAVRRTSRGRPLVVLDSLAGGSPMRRIKIMDLCILLFASRFFDKLRSVHRIAANASVRELRLCEQGVRRGREMLVLVPRGSNVEACGDERGLLAADLRIRRPQTDCPLAHWPTGTANPPTDGSTDRQSTVYRSAGSLDHRSTDPLSTGSLPAGPQTRRYR